MAHGSLSPVQDFFVASEPQMNRQRSASAEALRYRGPHALTGNGHVPKPPARALRLVGIGSDGQWSACGVRAARSGSRWQRAEAAGGSAVPVAARQRGRRCTALPARRACGLDGPSRWQAQAAGGRAAGGRAVAGRPPSCMSGRPRWQDGSGSAPGGHPCGPGQDAQGPGCGPAGMSKPSPARRVMAGRASADPEQAAR